MHTLRLLLFHSLLAGIALAFIACSEDEGEAPGPDSTPVEGSMVSPEEGNWSHFRFSQSFYSGRAGSSFESGIDMIAGSVILQQPLFLTSHQFIRGGLREDPLLKLTIPSEEEMISTDLPFVIRDKEDRGQTVPSNISDLGALGFSGDQKFFLSGREAYGWYHGQRKRFGAWFPVRFSAIADARETFGWSHTASASKFPSEIDLPDPEKVTFQWLGDLDLAVIDETRTMVFPGWFDEFDGSGRRKKRMAILGKKWSLATDDIDFVKVLPEDKGLLITDESAFFLGSGQSKAIGETVLTLISYEDKTHFIVGTFATGFEFVKQLEEISIIKIYQSNDAFFCVYRTQANSSHVLKIDTDGTITEYPSFNVYGSFSHYNGDPVIALSDPDNEQKLTVYRLTAGGLIPLGTPGFTVQATSRAFATSDGENLYVAVTNCLAPKYQGINTQWCGWEIIQYKP